MTREEAKEILTHNWTRVDNPNYSESELDEAFFMAIEALSEKTSTINEKHQLSEETPTDLISRQDAIRWVKTECNPYGKPTLEFESGKRVIEHLKKMPSAEPKTKWIPCSERLPKDLEAVNVTWVNHNPPCYYIDIMNVPFTATGVYHDGKWYWWDATVMDLLGEYDGAYVHGIEPIDKYIEITAWMPLPTPYKGGDDE